MISNIHIGRIIQEEVFLLNVSLSELSDRMFLNEKFLLFLFNRRSIDINLLYRWSTILKVDLFEIYTDYLSQNEYAIDVETMLHSLRNNHNQKFLYNDEV